MLCMTEYSQYWYQNETLFRSPRSLTPRLGARKSWNWKQFRGGPITADQEVNKETFCISLTQMIVSKNTTNVNKASHVSS